MKSQSYIKPDKDKMSDLVSKRYERMEGKIPFTIRKYDKDPSFEATFLLLKKKGYPDWAIYMALMNMSVNFRLQKLQKQGLKDPKLLNDSFKVIMNEIEKEEDALPEDELTEQKIEWAIDLTVMSFLKGEGFEIRRATPNIKALRAFAENELDFFKYDLPHKKWFSFEKDYEK